MKCANTYFLNQYLAELDRDQMIEDFENAVIDDHVDTIIKQCAEMTFDEMEAYLAEQYDFELIEYLNDHLVDDGNFDYFVRGRNDYYTKAMLNVCEAIDFTSWIEHEKEIAEERALGI